MKKNRILVSFSGGQTSAYMLQHIIKHYPEKEIMIAFANTGQEHPETYEFIQNVALYNNVHINWIECDVPEDRELKTSYKVVDYKTACRDGRLFEDVTKRFGIPSTIAPMCTRELKVYPLAKFVKDRWEKGTYDIALGIRADEIDRVNPDYEKINYTYPLAWNGTTKEIVNSYWDDQVFQLNIPNYLGNCVWCWKKSFKKLKRVLEDSPEWFDVPDYIEKKYEINNIPTQKARFGGKQSFFRGRQTVEDLRNMLKKDQMKALEQKDSEDSYENSCAESCEVFTEDLDDAL